MLDTLQSTQVAALNRRTVPHPRRLPRARRRHPRHAHGADGAAHRRASPACSPTSATGSATAARSRRSSRWRPGWRRRLAERCRYLPEIAGWTRRLHDHAYAHGGGRRGAGLPRRRPFDLDGHDQRRRPALPRAGPRARHPLARRPCRLQHARETSPSGNMHGMALSFLAGEESLAPILASRPFASGAAVEHPRLRRALDRPGREGAAARARRRHRRHARRSTSAASRRSSPSGSRAGGRAACTCT